MSASRLDVLERNLERAFRRYHADAQIRRILLVFAGTLALQMRDGIHDWTVKGLLSLAAAAGVATLRRFVPTVSQSLVLQHVQAQKALEPQPAPPAEMPAPTPAPTAEQVYASVTPRIEPPTAAPPTAAK